MDTIEGMRVFAAVAHHSSFTAGAAQIGISTKLASKYVGLLETRLNAQLLHRTTRSVTLTDTGRAYLERCLPLLEQFEELEGHVQRRQGELAGRIKVTAPTGYGSAQLVHRLRTFQRIHPKVAIDLHLSDQNLSLVDGGYDLAVRFGALKDSNLVARKLTDMRIVFCASPAYLSEMGRPERPEDLINHNCILVTTTGPSDTWEFKNGQSTFGVRVTGNFNTNSPRAAAHMASDGLGIARIPLYTVEPFLKTSELELLFEDKEAGSLGLYAVYPPSRHLTVRIRALIEHLVATT